MLTLLAGVLLLISPSVAAAQVDLPQGPATCYDADVRFPGAHTPRDAVNYALMDLGYSPFRTNPFRTEMLNYSPKIVGGWVATSLIRNRIGYDAPTLAQWIGEGNTLSFSLTPAEWNAMLTWEPDACEGAFVQNPANSDIMRLVGSLVIRGR